MAAHKRVHFNNLGRNIKISVIAVLLTLGVLSEAQSPFQQGDLQSPFADSSLMESDEGLTAQECAEKNPEFFPEFTADGFKCCSTRQFWSASGNSSSKKGRRRRGAPFCAPGRNGWDKCGERTPEQIRYEAEINAMIAEGKLGERTILERLEGRIRKRSDLKLHSQSYCSPANGFVDDALPIVPTPTNRILLNWNDRCANYGNDLLVHLMEWLGNEIREEYSEEDFANARLIIGDAGAPKGGCLAVRRGKRGHRSHTNGQDIDIAFFNPRSLNERQLATLRTYRDQKKSDSVPEELLPSTRFTTEFYVASNYWLLKKMYSVKNTTSCVRSVFLDRRHKARLARYANSIGDKDWERISDYIQHEKGHYNHFHLRVVPMSQNGMCYSLNALKRMAQEEFKRTGKMPDTSKLGLSDSEGEYYGDPELEGDLSENPALQDIHNSLKGDAKSGENLEEDSDDADEGADDSADAKDESTQVVATAMSGKPSEAFMNAQKDIQRGEALNNEANANPSKVSGLRPDHKREPEVTRNFPSGGSKRARRGKKSRSKGAHASAASAKKKGSKAGRKPASAAGKKSSKKSGAKKKSG